MYKVKNIANGMIIWKGNAIIGIKGATLPEMFDDCDCYKVPGNAFDYALAPNQEFTKEQLDFINKAAGAWDEEEDEEYVDDINKTSMDIADGFYDWPDDDLPF